MKIKYFILLLLAVPLLVSGQEQEKKASRFLLEAGVSLWPNLFYPTPNNKGFRTFLDQNNDGLTFQDHYHLTVQYAFSPKVVLGLGYEYSLSGLRSRAYTPSKIVYGLLDYQLLFYNLTAHDARIKISYYLGKQGAKLPLGWHIEWGLDAVFVSGRLLDQKVYYGHQSNFNQNQPAAKYLNPLEINKTTFMLGFRTGFGYRFLIRNRFTIDVAARFISFPQVFFELLGEFRGLEDISNAAYYRKEAERRINDGYGLNLVLSFGVYL